MGDALIEYKEFPGGHLQFFIGKDASYFTKYAMDLIKKHNPLPE